MMLELKNISKIYDSFVLDNISLSVEKGDYFVLLGASGAGKTLILEIIAGIIQADKGLIFLDNENITNKKIQKREIGLVFQDLAVFPHLSVKENIEYPLKNYNIKKSIIREKTNKIAEKLNIDQILNRRPSTLSGGELQRVALARTLVSNPKILLLDEPLSSIDIQLKNDLRKLLRRINNAGQTIIHVTHDYEEAVLLANKVAVLNEGKLLQTGTAKEVFQFPKSKFVASFTGVRNFFPCIIKPSDSKGLKTVIIDNSIEIKLQTDEMQGSGFILIRDNAIFVSNHKPETSACNIFFGEILEIIPIQNSIELVVNLGIKLSVLISLESFEKLSLIEGKKVWVGFKATNVKYLPK